MMTGPLCRAARALIEIDLPALATVCGLDAELIDAYERKLAQPDKETLKRLKSVLEDLGASFIPEDTRGVGVRLKFTESERKRLQVLEGEGGIVRPDDVP
jgi:transcriptional regulator with XRE-family HTH domain